MPIEDMFQAGTDKVLDDRVARPIAEPPVQRSFGSNAFGVASALPRGLGSAANETTGFWSDILGAYGDAQASHLSRMDPTLMFDKEQAAQLNEQRKPAAERLQTGAAFTTEAGTNFRYAAKDFAPDPESATAAENLIFSLSRFMGKAVGYSLAAGPVPGAIMTGADEGMTEASRLAGQGVDIETRTKVGATAGVVAGVSVALPIAGTSWKTTAGLVAAGGPGGFIAQQAASKAILENANYSELADQYDPFDPVGLAVSTLVPAAFGGYAMRSARARAATPSPADPAAARELQRMAANERTALKYNDPRLDAYAVTAAQREGIPPEMLLAIKNAGERSNSGQVSRAGAKGVMQFMDRTWAEYGRGDPRDPTASIDAGARYLKVLLAQYDNNMQAALAHYDGGTKAGQAVARGEPAPYKETRDYLVRTERFIAERAGEEQGRAAAADPEMVAAARVQQVRQAVESSNPHAADDALGAQRHVDSVLRSGDQLAAGQRVDVAETLDPVAQVKILEDMAVRMQQEALPDLFPPAGQAIDAAQIEPIRAELETLQQLRQSIDEVSARIEPDVHAAVKFADEGKAEAYLREKKIARTHRIENTGRDEYSIRPKKQGRDWRQGVEAREAKLAEQLRIANENAAARAAARAETAPASETAAPTRVTEPAEAPTADAAPKADANPLAASIDAQAAELARLAPDMMVQLEGMPEPMRLADALESVRAEAAKDAETAPLYQVAAECALQNL